MQAMVEAVPMVLQMQVDLARLERFMELPHRGARTDVAPVELAVEHGAARDDDGRHVATRRAHQQRGRGLVAAGQQHDGVDRVAAHGFFHVHGREVARQHGGGPQVGLAVREHRELDRETAGFIHAALDVLGDLAKVRVARRQLRPGVADADDRLALEFVVGNALVLHPAAVHEAVLVGMAEPFGRAQLGLAVGHLVSCGRRLLCK
jgi:hypothetical protein